jgi:hypothetical protein
VQGSGSFTTPQALILEAEGLQPVIPKDQLGMATADFATKKLAPGEAASFTVTALAIEPNKSFSMYTHDLYNAEEIYIADLEWADLQGRYPELNAAKAGSYTATVKLEYAIDAGGMAAVLSGPTGYARAEVLIGVTE